MNNQDQEIKADNNCKSCFCLSWVLFFHLLFTSGFAYAQAHADKSRVGDIQLLLSLEGYELDTHRVDGILGQVTKKSIKDYRKKKNLPPVVNANELIDDELYNSLYEDTKSKLPMPPVKVEEKTGDNKTINTLAGELNTTRDDLKDTKAELKALKDDISANSNSIFASSYISLIAFILGIFTIFIAILLSWILPVAMKRIMNDIEKTYKKMVKHSANHISAGLLTEFSGYFLNLYEDFDTTSSQQQMMLHDSYLGVAKNISDRAYYKAKELEKSTKLTDLDRGIITQSINNKLFYMVTPYISDAKRGKNKPTDDPEVKKVLDEMRHIYHSINEEMSANNWWNLKETLIWAEFNTAKSVKAIPEITDKVQCLISHDTPPPGWGLEIYNRYKKHRTVIGLQLTGLKHP